MTDATLPVTALGVRIDVDLALLPDAERDQFRTAWSRSVTSYDLGPAAQTLAVDAPGPSGARIVADRLSGEITIAAITENAGKLIMLHAAGLAEPGTGRTIAFVGPSGRGKTTLTQVLGQHWDYVSDETVAVDPTTLQVFPHPKPLSVKVAGSGLKDQLGADELGLRPTPTQCQLAKVVLLERIDDHDGPPEVIPYDIPTAVGHLAGETSFLDRWPDPLGVLAALLATTGGAVALRYGQAGDLVGLLPSLLEAPGGTEWSATPAAPVATSPGHWRRESVPAITGDGRIAVLAGVSGRSQVTVLDGIGPLLWELTAEPRTLDELVAAVVDAVGPPPEGEAGAAALVVAALRSLRDHGVVTDGLNERDAGA